MGKVVLYIATSLDMYIARENGEVDWLFEEGDYGYEDFWGQVEATLMGKKTYDQVLSFGGEFPYIGKENYVFTRDASLTDTEHVQFISGDIPSFIQKIRKKAENYVWLIGGGEIIRICMQAALVDELRLFVHPVILGKGIPLFLPQEHELAYKLRKVNPFPNDLLELRYEKK